MKVLVIPEDPTHDQFVLKPIVQALVEDVGLQARVDVLTDPHLRGVSEALAPRTVAQIVEDNPMVNLFLLMVDRDCDRMGNVKKAQDRAQEYGGRLLACLAEQEVEVWALALHRDELDAAWKDVRVECDPKERYFDPLVARQGWRGPGGGRKTAMRAFKGQLAGLLRVCDELKQLRDEIAAWKEQRGAR